MTPKGSRPVLRGLVGSNAHPATQLIDVVAVLFGSAISGERTREAFDERTQPWTTVFLALFGRDRLPARSTLSRFLAARDLASVESLRTRLLQERFARPLTNESQPGGLWDRLGTHFLVFALDGTREVARQRALPVSADRPGPARRLRPVCAPGSTGRKRGEMVRTRTTIWPSHTHQWLGPFGHPGKGADRQDLRGTGSAIPSDVQSQHVAEAPALVRGDGHEGTEAVLADLAGRTSVPRGKDARLLDRVAAPTRLHLPPDQQIEPPERGMGRALSARPDLRVGTREKPCRIVVATHPASEKKSRMGVTRQEVVYERFLTHLPQSTLTARDVVALDLHRGACEPPLADPRSGTRP